MRTSILAGPSGPFRIWIAGSACDRGLVACRMRNAVGNGVAFKSQIVSSTSYATWTRINATHRQTIRDDLLSRFGEPSRTSHDVKRHRRSLNVDCGGIGRWAAAILLQKGGREVSDASEADGVGDLADGSSPCRQQLGRAFKSHFADNV